MLTFSGILAALWGGGAVMGWLLRLGLLPLALVGIPLVGKILDFCLDTLIGAGRLVGQAITVCFANPPVFILLWLTFLGGGVYYGEWRPFRSSAAAPPAVVTSSRPAPKKSAIRKFFSKSKSSAASSTSADGWAPERLGL